MRARSRFGCFSRKTSLHILIMFVGQYQKESLRNVEEARVSAQAVDAAVSACIWSDITAAELLNTSVERFEQLHHDMTAPIYDLSLETF